MIYIGVGLVGVILCFLYLIYIFFFRFWKFSAIISSNFTPLCLSLHLLGLPIIHIYYSWCCPRGQINYFCFLICLTFWCSDYLISLTLFFRSLMCSYLSPNLLLIPSSVFFISVIVFLSSDFLIFYTFQFFIKILHVFLCSFPQFS